MGNINGNQMRILRSCLQIELGSSIFATQHKIYQIVNLEYVEPVTGIFKFGSERIPWYYKAIEKCLMLWMEMRKERENTTTTRHTSKYIYLSILIMGRGTQ